MTLPKIPTNKWSMRKKLVSYMLLLAGLLLFALFSGILMLGRFDSAEKNISENLSFQSEVFEKDMNTYFESLAANSIDLSQYISNFIDEDKEIAGSAFKTLTDNPRKIEELQTNLISSLSANLQNRNCSGIFMMLDATVNSQVENAALSRTGLYIQHNQYQNDEEFILFRGMSPVGKAEDIMPHRKWRLEFRTDQFPNYSKLVELSDKTLNEAYLITDCTTLSGTSKKVVLVAIPVVGADGTFYGICGYEVSSDYFATYHARPASQYRTACMLLYSNDNSNYSSTGLSYSSQNNYVEPPSGDITCKSHSNGMSEFSDGSQSFVGVCSTVKLTPNNNDYTLSVMFPKYDYTALAIESTMQVVILIILLLFFAVSSCIFFSKRYLSPILKGLEQAKQKAWETESSTVPEINELLEHLEKQDEEHTTAISSVQNELEKATKTYEEAQKRYDEAEKELELAQIELHRLSYSRKNEVDPDKYRAFLSGIKNLTATEKTIFNYYVDGKSVKEIMELARIKETTIRFHNRNIYSKLGVNSLKQLLLYAAVMNQTKENKGDEVK